MNELALFAGAGGGILASIALGHRIVCAVEVDPYCREVLLRRQEEGILSPFPVWDDVRTFNGEQWRGAVDIISAGFPCQPFSVLGKREGKDDAGNFWPETIRIIREVRSRLAFLENVPGLLSTRSKAVEGDSGECYFGTVLRDLAEAGYDAIWTVLGADDCGGPHRRKRLWILAYDTRRQDTNYGRGVPDYTDHESKHVCTVHDEARGLPAVGSHIRGWKSPPMEFRMGNGFPYRMDRLRASGNAQVPVVAIRAFQELMKLRRGV